ncbi:MAG: chromate efflux transporter [Rhodoferax sp.]
MPGLAQALPFWLKLGFISFGGPAGQIAIMHSELVQKRRWISEKRFLHALNYCMVLPGPEAQQLATYIGWLMHRTRGALVAGGLFVLPSLFILIALSWVYMAFGQVGWVAALLYGIKPAVTAIVLHAAWRIGSRTLRNASLWGIALAAFVALFVLQLPFPAIVLGAAALGWLGARIAPRHFQAQGGHAQADASTPAAPALIDDDTPTPAHARWSGHRLAVVLLTGALLWAVPMALLGATWGWQHAYTQMGWFFTKAALLTFGGAYAVLPYVYQGAVQTHGWLNPAQMMDGLALGETTPGPLIMVVAFVAFVGGYGHTLLGPDAPFLAGALAATLVTWFTFLPSFLFILAGGPLVEATHGQWRLTAPLTAITAAVVGVIVNLALFFGAQVLWPQGLQHAPDLAALAIALAATVALVRYQRNVIHVIGVCALAGLLVKTLF